MYYNIYTDPEATQTDDLEVMLVVNKLARVIYEMPPIYGANRRAVVRTIRDAIEAASRGLNHGGAENEVRAFCHYVTDEQITKDEVDALMADYLGVALRMVEEGWE